MDSRAQKKKALVSRLESLSNRLAEDPRVLGLLGLGSIGAELSRMDEYSDLDFFLIVQEGTKGAFLESPNWLDLEEAQITWSFKNTVDGYKALYQDGIYVENAVFAPSELPNIPYNPGRWWLQKSGLDESLAKPALPLPEKQTKDPYWLLGEILSCIYVGLCRFYRGEKLSAWRFISGHAFSMFLELYSMNYRENNLEDPFSIERRFEQRHPELDLSPFLQGYERIPEASLYFTRYMQENFSGHEILIDEIFKLLEDN
jgi:lincosamide nucleotidyltransferase